MASENIPKRVVTKKIAMSLLYRSGYSLPHPDQCDYDDPQIADLARKINFIERERDEHYRMLKEACRPEYDELMAEIKKEREESGEDCYD